MALTMGSPATDRSSSAAATLTMVLFANPAGEAGVVTDVQVYAYQAMSGVKVGSFSRSGAEFTPRDYEILGNVAAGEVVSFPGLSIDVESGDYLGIYYSAGRVESDPSGGVGVYYKSGDQFGAGEQTYTFVAGWTLSCYGYAAIVAAGRSWGVIF